MPSRKPARNKEAPPGQNTWLDEDEPSDPFPAAIDPAERDMRNTARLIEGQEIGSLPASPRNLNWTDYVLYENPELEAPLEAPVFLPASYAIEHPEPTNNERLQMLDKRKSFTHEGVRYFPLSAAAPVIQAPRSTLVHWINKQTKFDGRPLQIYYFAPANRYFISEESIVRAANRFIKWPSQEPAGKVTLGEQRDQSGFIGFTEAARILGVDHHTIWRWLIKGTAPTDEPLDVVKCPAADQYYIRQKDVKALKKFVPRAGLRSGRRPQPTLQAH